MVKIKVGTLVRLDIESYPRTSERHGALWVVTAIPDTNLYVCKAITTGFERSFHRPYLTAHGGAG